MSDLHVHGDDTFEEIDFSLVSLEEVTEQSLRSVLNLSVSEKQSEFVAANAISISQAYFSKTAWFRAICYKKVPVGFLMLDDDHNNAEYFLWRLMVDQRFQHNRFGTKALELLVEYVKTRPDAKELITSCKPGEGSPAKFYEHFGFKATGQKFDTENVYSFKL